jgi:carbonic anhydrase/acetyltransferase-like protein (isoleucine patch superfamily)
MPSDGNFRPPDLFPFGEYVPRIDPTAFVAPDATIIGDVEVGARSGIWFKCVLRGDVRSIRVGDSTNIQDATIVHVTRRRASTAIGSHVTIGHRAIIHGCTIEDSCFIGMAATVMDEVVVESGAMVAAGALVTPRKRVGAGQLWGGAPAKHMRDLTPEEKAYMADAASHYAELAESYRRQLYEGIPAPSIR